MGDLKAMPQWARGHAKIKIRHFYTCQFQQYPSTQTQPCAHTHLGIIQHQCHSFLFIILFNLSKMSQVFACLINLMGPWPLSLSPLLPVLFTAAEIGEVE